ncbi:hypothetical protein [Spiroplasma melliferum]|uniref:Uncharacterized protein n=2 Tax=Spiroplasma melliferum TaxID=2134 RepID=A0AAI9X0T9_SPIME|nr:hypothetical protein [Spiroplasma melliferum]ELL44129.1 hypothetical protein SMIPMB4A_v3c9530 [Spiroplasma melliferum IPMB4A]KAI92349.1 hypothetical protein SPM_006480 [Spiroplasma melliferum KC3]QCO23795.1 hypothetical protein SRED_002269 [Spiroplasma melliferum]
MKTLLTNLIAIVLIATPTAISAQNVVRTQQKEHANITLFTNTNDISISSHAGITFQWWYTSDSHSSNTADLINIDDYATSLNDFVHLFPKIKISNSVGNITQNYIGYSNPIYPAPHNQGNFSNKPVVLNTADLFKIGQSVDTIIGSYSYSDTSTTATSESHIVTAITSIAGKTFLTMYCTSVAKGNAGPFSEFVYNSADTNINKVEFLANEF